jgi:hypothetical protein
VAYFLANGAAVLTFQSIIDTLPCSTCLFCRYKLLFSGGPWFCMLPADAWPDDASAAAELRADFAHCLGDRRQELVFIGENL